MRTGPFAADYWQAWKYSNLLDLCVRENFFGIELSSLDNWLVGTASWNCSQSCLKYLNSDHVNIANKLVLESWVSCHADPAIVCSCVSIDELSACLAVLQTGQANLYGAVGALYAAWQLNADVVIPVLGHSHFTTLCMQGTERTLTYFDSLL